MANNVDKDIDAFALGLGEIDSKVNVEAPAAAPVKEEVTEAPAKPVVKEKKVTKKKDAAVEKVEAAAANAAATAALKVAIEASDEMSQKQADKEYIIQKKKFMLNKCKEDDVVEFVGQKIFADVFGKTYTFLYNTIPVTVRFDGTKQKLPRFIYDFVMEKITQTSESNTPTVESVKLD